MINLNQGENIITNKEVKLLLVEFLSDKIQFCKLYQANQSLIVFHQTLVYNTLYENFSQLTPLNQQQQKFENP